MCGWCGLRRRWRQKVAPNFPLHKTKLDQQIQVQGKNPEGAVSVGDKPAMAVGPYAEVDNCLRGLAGAAEGFGSAAIGGLHGEVYCVTSLADDGPGSLRDGCRRKEPLWIVFKVSGTIVLSSYCHVASFKTIDGRGQRIRITGKGLRLKHCEHVIISNLVLNGGRGPDVDGIQIKPDTKHVWVDRCSISDFDDGCIDITRGSTDITVSRCHFTNHNKTMLIGADPKHIEDRCIRVTIHHCFFDGTRQRHPRVRFGKVHIYNNYTRNWAVYAVCASVEAQILSQCCIYEAGDQKTAFEYYTEKAADKGVEASGNIHSEDDLLLKGAEGQQMNPSAVFQAETYYSQWTLERANEELMKKVSAIAGWQNIPRPPGAINKHPTS